MRDSDACVRAKLRARGAIIIAVSQLVYTETEMIPQHKTRGRFSLLFFFFSFLSRSMEWFTSV